MSDDFTTIAADVGMAVGFEHAAAAVARRVRGPAGLVAQGALAVGELGTTGHMRGSSALGVAASAASMVGARLIPGVGWAMLAYTGADLASQAFLGKPFGETWVGKPIDWAIDKAERGGIGLATRAFDAVGWTGTSRFMDETLRPWALGEAAAPNGFTRGPETAMTADDWYEHPPREFQARQPNETAPTHVEPDPADVTRRRSALLENESAAIEHETMAEDLGITTGIDANAVRRMANALGLSGTEPDATVPEPRRDTGFER